MAIFFQKQEKQKKKLILLFIVLILFITYIVWLMFFQKEEIEVINKYPLALPRKEIRINFEVLKDPRIEKLRLFPNIEPIETGRENPFIPY